MTLQGERATVGVTATDDGKNCFCSGCLFWTQVVSGTHLLILTTIIKIYILVNMVSLRFQKEKNPALSDSNTALMAEVHQGTVVYGSAWEVKGGDIQLSIEKTSGIYEGMVMIRYRDSQNVENKIKSDLDDI